MAYEADRVVVSLVADNSNFDANVRQSASAYQQGMTAIETAAGGAEKAHGRMTLSMNNSRIAMLEFQHVARSTADQIAVGAPPMQIFATHLAQLTQAATLVGGALGRVGAFLSGPWGIALTLATVAVVGLISHHKEEEDTLDSLLRKKQEHAEKSKLNAEVDDIWKHSIDGVIESEKALADQLEKTNKIQSVANQTAYANAQGLVTLRAQQLAQAQSQFNEGDPRLQKATEAFHEAVRELNELQTIVSQQQGEALADLSSHADLWADKQEQIIRNLQRYHPELQQYGDDIQAAFAKLKAAVSTAASAGINVDPVTHHIDQLNQKLLESPDYIQGYIKNLREAADQITKFTTTAQNAPKAIEDFKRSLIGAEGTGRNAMGSSAAGYGQFMPATFEHYFRQAYPDQAGLSNAVIDDLRNNKQVAEGVIDVATKDYVAILQRAGQQITAAALYTMHMLSAGDPHGTVALRLLNAPADASARSIVGNRVVAQNGNIFTGTAGDARDEIARRIGDSSSAVTAGATALQRALDAQLENLTKINTLAQDAWHTEQKVTIEKDHQVNYAELYNAQNRETLMQLAEGLVDMTKWNRQYEQLTNSQKEFNDFGSQMLDTIFNPDNWRNWGDLGKQVLHELELEILKLGALNPLKNLLFGQNNATLGGVFANLFHSGSPLNLAGGMNFGSGGLDFGIKFAGGGSVSGPGTGTSDSVPAMLSAGEFVMSAAAVNRIGVDRLNAMNEGRRFFAEGGLVRRVTPANDIAASPMGAFGHSTVLVSIEASEYFDGRVLKVTGPVMAQVGTRAAAGGATLSRRNLGREQMHQLD